MIKGKLGGYIASEKNISHENNAWVYEDVYVAEACLLSFYGKSKNFKKNVAKL